MSMKKHAHGEFQNFIKLKDDYNLKWNWHIIYPHTSRYPESSQSAMSLPDLVCRGASMSIGASFKPDLLCGLS